MSKRQGQWSSLPREPGAKRSSVGVVQSHLRKAVMTQPGAQPRRRLQPPTARYGAQPQAETEARWERHANDVMRNHWQAEMRLWATVLVDAVKCLRTEGALRQETREWIMERDPDYTLGSFDGICCQLDLDEDYVRRDLLGRTPGCIMLCSSPPSHTTTTGRVTRS